MARHTSWHCGDHINTSLSLYTQETPLPVDPSMFPTWPAKSEMAALKKDKAKEKSPSAPEGGAFLNQVKVEFQIFLQTGCRCGCVVYFTGR